MLKNKFWLGIILSIFLLIFSMPGFTAYYKYTQESGANFYVGTADKADALEDTNEMRQIIDDLGALLVHSKRDDLYPKDLTTGGTIQIPEAGLKFSNDPVNGDIAAYIAGEMTWQTKAELGIDLSLYYLKTDIDSLSEVEAIYVKNIIDSDELAALKFTDLADTPANYTGQAGKYVKVNAGETDLEFGTPAGAGTYLELTDTPAAYDNGKYAKSTADGVIWDDPAGAGDMLKATYDNDEDGDIDVTAGGTEKSSWTLYCIPYLSGTTAFGEIPIGTAEYALTVNAGANGYDFTLFDLSLYYLKTEIDTLSEVETIYTKDIIDSDELSALNYKGKNYYSALGSDHTYSDNADTDNQPVGESVVFGDLLYPDWTEGEWLKADADLAAKMPGLRIALEDKADGQTCLMLVKGYIRDDSAFEFAGSMVYTSVTPGAMSSTAPSVADQQLQRVGVAKSADILFFDPSIDVGEI